MPQASRSVVVDVTPDQFMSVISDYEKYPEFLPEVKKTTVSNRTENAADVQYEIEVIKRIKYTLRLVRQGYSVSWNLVGGELFKKNQGSWEIRPEEGGKKTHATYNLEVGFGLIPVPSSIINMLAEQSLPGLLSNFKKRAESLFPGQG